MIRKKLIIVLFFVGLFFPLSSVFAGTVLNDHKYAWGNNLGYVNFENVFVNDTNLSGFAWSSNYGWINLQPLTGGVLNDTHGNLSGFAWGEQLGWIDFGGVSIHPSTGRFSGTAVGGLSGIITFDCPNYCDVETDWRGTPEAVSESEVSNSGNQQGNGGGGATLSSPSPISSLPVVPIVSSPVINVKNDVFTLPEGKAGIFSQDTSFGSVEVRVPAIAGVGELTFIIENQPISQKSIFFIPKNTDVVQGVFFDIFVKNENGERVHSFSEPLMISFPLPEKTDTTKNLAVYWLNEVNSQWVLIPDAIFSDTKVSFRINHLTRFAIFATNKEKIKNISVTPAPKIPFAVDKKILSEKVSSEEAPLFDVISEFGVKKIDQVSQDASTDAESGELTVKVAPGGMLPILVKLLNFEGGQKVGVEVQYSVVDHEGKEILSTSDSINIETITNFVKTLQIPPGTPPGIYTAKTSIQYQGQVVPAITQFQFMVERKVFGLFQNQLFLYGGVVILLSFIVGSLWALWFLRKNPQTR